MTDEVVTADPSERCCKEIDDARYLYETEEDVPQCNKPATHTCIWDGERFPFCDEHGVKR